MSLLPSSFEKHSQNVPLPTPKLQNISASHARNLAGMVLLTMFYTTLFENIRISPGSYFISSGCKGRVLAVVAGILTDILPQRRLPNGGVINKTETLSKLAGEHD